MITKGRDSLETEIIHTVFTEKRFKNYDSLVRYSKFKKKLLQQSGFIDIEKTEEKKINDTVFRFTYNLNYKYETITIHYNPTVLEKEIVEQIAKKTSDSTITLPITHVEPSLITINDQLSAKGIPFSSVQLTNFKKKDTTLHATLTIEQLKARKISSVTIKGYTNFPKTFINHYSNLKRGQLFKRKLIRNQSKLLDNLGFVKNIKDPEVLFTKDSTVVYLYLKKVPANIFDGFIGFSNDSESQDFQINGNLTLTLLNNLNYGEKLFLTYKRTESEQQLLKIAINLPYLFKSPIGLGAGLSIFRQDSTFITTDQNIDLTYQISSKSNLSLGYERTTSDNLQEDVATLFNISEYTSNFVKGGYAFQLPRPLILFPNIFFFETSLFAGNRNSSEINTNQQKGTVTLNYTPALNSRNYIHVENQSAMILSDSLFTNELYRFGGLLSIRGFEENSINASLYSVLRTEYRFLLSRNLYVHSILDFAYFEDDTQAESSNLSTIGFGVAFNTKTGIFKLQFANGKTSNDSFKFNNTRVHLSLLARF